MSTPNQQAPAFITAVLAPPEALLPYKHPTRIYPTLIAVCITIIAILIGAALILHNKKRKPVFLEDKLECFDDAFKFERDVDAIDLPNLVAKPKPIHHHVRSPPNFDMDAHVTPQRSTNDFVSQYSNRSDSRIFYRHVEDYDPYAAPEIRVNNMGEPDREPDDTWLSVLTEPSAASASGIFGIARRGGSSRLRLGSEYEGSFVGDSTKRHSVISQDPY